jgi:hypothetical protein
MISVTQFTKDRSAWKTATYRNIATGDEYTLYDEDAPSTPGQIDAMCYGGTIEQHRFILSRNSMDRTASPADGIPVAC